MIIVLRLSHNQYFISEGQEKEVILIQIQFECGGIIKTSGCRGKSNLLNKTSVELFLFLLHEELVLLSFTVTIILWMNRSGRGDQDPVFSTSNTVIERRQSSKKGLLQI